LNGLSIVYFVHIIITFNVYKHVQVVGYFMGLVPNTPKSVIKVTDQATNSEKWFSASEIEGSPAVKFDLSLRKPIILMPRRTDSLE